MATEKVLTQRQKMNQIAVTSPRDPLPEPPSIPDICLRRMTREEIEGWRSYEAAWRKFFQEQAVRKT